MPIYELVCQECGNQYERIVSFSATSYPACPACGAGEVSRLPSKPAIHFKGSGWYINDSKNEDAKRKAAAEGTNGSGEKAEAGTESSETKTDSAAGSTESSKTESKSDAKDSTKSEAKSDAKAAD